MFANKTPYSTNSKNTKPSGDLLWLENFAHYPKRMDIFDYALCKAMLLRDKNPEYS